MIADSGAWVSLIVHGPQPRDGDMCIELRGRQRRVAEQFLHDAQVRATFEKMGGRTVPKAMRPDIGPSVYGGDGLVHDGAGLPLIEPPAARAEE